MANLLTRGQTMASRAEIGKKVRAARKSLGYTQLKLSELIRINKTTISEI